MDEQLCEQHTTTSILESTVNITQGTRHSGLQRNRFSNLASMLAVTLIAGMMVGCASSGKNVILGRVISGPVGQSVGASPADERFLEPGIPGAEISVLSKTGSASRGRGVYAKATSDDWGNFEISFANGQFPRDAVQIRVEGEGIFTSRSTAFLPDEGDSLLSVVITRPGYVIPEPPEDESKDKK